MRTKICIWLCTRPRFETSKRQLRNAVFSQLSPLDSGLEAPAKSCSIFPIISSTALASCASWANFKEDLTSNSWQLKQLYYVIAGLSPVQKRKRTGTEFGKAHNLISSKSKPRQKDNIENSKYNKFYVAWWKINEELIFQRRKRNKLCMNKWWIHSNHSMSLVLVKIEFPNQ